MMGYRSYNIFHTIAGQKEKSFCEDFWGYFWLGKFIDFRFGKVLFVVMKLWITLLVDFEMKIRNIFVERSGRVW